MDILLEEFIFWGIWLIIPIIVDILIGVSSSIIIFISYFKNKEKKKELEYYPNITIIVPVYNSELTLRSCIRSIASSRYPIKNIQVLLIDNGSTDTSYEIYCELQAENPKLRLWWLDSSKGKAKALNKGLYMAEGKYIINIDSDGALEENALKNLVYKFEMNPKISAMTGAVLTSSEDIKRTKRFYMRIAQRCELFEYTEAFLVGRAFQGKTNTMFTLSGAFSAFRKEVVLKTQMYNGETLGEDTHMTSQIRILLKGKIDFCEDAFFYVDPVETLDKLYTQRQRWQRGQIEVGSLFNNNSTNKRANKVFKLRLLVDHTLVFPRIIWFFAMIYLIFIDYPLKLIVGATILMYLLYVINSVLQFLVSKLYLKDEKETKKYMNRHIYTILLLPLYRTVVFVIRGAGIINSIERNGKWNTKSFTEEKKLVKDEIGERLSIYYKLRRWINSE